MKINAHFLIAAISCLVSTFTAFADWEYVETSGTSFNKGGSGYLKDENSSWIIPASRAKTSYNLTVDLTLTDITLVRCDDSVPWDFTTVKTTTVKDQPEMACYVVSFIGCSGINITQLIAPDCIEIKNSIFANCSELESICLPKCEYLGQYTFSYCTSLKSFYIPQFSRTHSGGSTSLFEGCTGLKEFEWNCPNFTVLFGSMFKGCSSLSKVSFKTPITEFKGSVFFNIASGAELYMHREAPSAIGENAFANQGREKANRIFLQGNYEAWLEAFKVNHHIIPLGNDAELAAFNDGWEEIASGTTIRKRSHVIDQMIRDDDICRIEDINNTPKNSGDDKVTLLKRGLLAYAVRKHSGNASYSYGCWIFKVPREGLKVIVK